MPLNYNSLSALSPVVRKEVLTGELVRKVKATESLGDKDVGALVDSMVSLSLSNVLQYLDDSSKLQEQIQNYKVKLLPTETPETNPSRAVSKAPSSHASSEVNPATASAPEHPSTPVSMDQSLSTPPRTSSPAGSMPPLSERDRIYGAISRLEPSRQAELTELVMSLPKKDRALCLFNNEILRSKIVDAKAVLDSDDGDVADAQSTKSAPAPVPVTPKKRVVQPASTSSPQTPDLSSRGPSAAASPAPATPGNNVFTSSYTIASLARLPAAEIIRLANSSNATGLPLPKADASTVQTTDNFIDGLLKKPLQQQKQAVGGELFKVVKSLGIKMAVSLCPRPFSVYFSLIILSTF
jgi:polyadenylate-binding protein